jgi:hypothetical protein
VVQHRGRSIARALIKHPSGILLAAQLVGVLLYPFMQVSVVGRVAFEAFGALVLALAIWSVRSSAGRTSSTIAIGLGVVASGLSITDAVHHTALLQLAAALFHAMFYFWAAGNLMGYMLADNRVTRDELFAVGATFTLVAWAFAYLFTVLQQLQPGCFTAAVNPEAQRSWVELLFLSFTNLSSTGLSDIVPITAQSRAVVMIEQLAGLGYVALFVSRLVGLQMSRHMNEDRRRVTPGAHPAADDSARPTGQGADG